MASVNRISPEGLKALVSVLVSGSGDFEDGTLKATILDTTTTADTDWDTSPNLSAIGTLGELSTVGRVTVPSVSVDVSGTQVQLKCGTITFPSLAAGTNTPEHVLIFVDKDGATTDTDRVPLLLADATLEPDGTDYSIVIPGTGIFDIDTA